MKKRILESKIYFKFNRSNNVPLLHFDFDSFKIFNVNPYVSKNVCVSIYIYIYFLTFSSQMPERAQRFEITKIYMKAGFKKNITKRNKIGIITKNLL